MTYYRIKVKSHLPIGKRGFTYYMYQVQWKGWWTLWLWMPLLAFERYDQANEYICYRECAKYRKGSK